MKKNITIYGLVDPRTGEVRYVGKTSRTAEIRLKGHWESANCGSEYPVHRWLRKLQRLELKPSLAILEMATEKTWAKLERRWVRHFGGPGGRMLNLNEGGAGLNNPTPEVRAKMSASHKGQKRTQEFKDLMSRLFKGRKISEKQKEQIRKTHTGRKHSEERRKAVSEGHKGLKQSAETIEKRVSKLRGRKQSAELIAKRRESCMKTMAARKEAEFTPGNVQPLNTTPYT